MPASARSCYSPTSRRPTWPSPSVPTTATPVRILWLKDPSKPWVKDNLVILRFRVVVFGLICSSFLLHGVFQHLLEYGPEWLVNRVEGHFYADNNATPCTDLDDAHRVYTAIKKLYASGGFNMRQWVSNSSRFNQSLPDKDRHPKMETGIVPLLGVQWDLRTDEIFAKAAKDKLKDALSATKREVFAFVAKHGYDILGLFAPVTITGRMMVQKVWLSKIDWDESLPDDLFQEWIVIKANLLLLPNARFPRQIVVSIRHCVHLLTFTDASEQALCAVVYAWQLVNGVISCNLVMSKATVVSHKNKRTIVQLELNAAVLGTRLMQFVVEHLNLDVKSRHLFSDSRITLSKFLATYSLSKYDQHRVVTVQEADYIYHHIAGIDNPADGPTRGQTFRQFSESNWAHGPSFLSTSTPQEWPVFSPTTKDIHSLAPPPVLLTPKVELPTDSDSSPFGIVASRFSSLPRLLGTTVYVWRFLLQLVLNVLPASLFPSAKELKQAKMRWVKAEQQLHYGETIQMLKAGKHNQLINNLDLFLDEDDIIRCGGRISNAPLSEAAKFPYILPSNISRQFVRLIVLDAHLRSGHQKVSGTLATLRLQAWIPRGFAFTKRVLAQSCSRCRLVSGPPLQPPKMGQLPLERLQANRAWQFTGVDHLGPLNVRIRLGATEYTHVWILLFTCLYSRAVHLELVLSVAAEQTINALRRFCARRGRPELLCSDQATGFIKAGDILQFLSGQSIEWRFQVPASPWASGVWERLIQDVKKCIRCCLWRRVVTYEEMITFLAEFEGYMNCRPLQTQRSEFGETVVIRPCDLACIGTQLGLPIPDVDIKDPEWTPLSSRQNLLRGFNKLHALTSLAFDFFQRHYITSLREAHTKFFRGQSKEGEWKPHVGQIYLVQEDNQARQGWKRCVVIGLLHGRDGLCRFAQVRFPSGHVTTRGIRDLVPLEAQMDEDTPATPVPKAIANGPTKQVTPPKVSLPAGQTATAAITGRRPVTRSMTAACIFLCLLNFVSGTTAGDLNFQLCTHGPGGKALILPEIEEECQFHTPRNAHRVINVTLFSPVSEYPRVDAFMCYYENTEVCTSSGIFGSGGITKVPTVTKLSATISDCRQAAKSHYHGLVPLKESRIWSTGSLFSTNITLTPEYRWWTSNYCTSVTNFILSKGQVSSFDGDSLETNLAFAPDCHIGKGECEIHNAIIFWNIQLFVAFCPFKDIGNFSAMHNDDLVAIDAHQSAFVIDEKTNAPPCLPRDTKMTKQGAALRFLPEPRLRRQIPRPSKSRPLILPPLSPSSGAHEERLNYLVERLNEIEEETMRRLHYSWCRQAQNELRRDMQLLRIDPTGTVRYILQRNDVAAEWVGATVMIHLCHRMVATGLILDHKLEDVHGEFYCTVFTPVRLTDGSIWFVSPGSRDLVPESPRTPCDKVITSPNDITNFTVHTNRLLPKVAWNHSERLEPFSSPPLFTSVISYSPGTIRFLAQETGRTRAKLGATINFVSSLALDSENVAKVIHAAGDTFADISHSSLATFKGLVGIGTRGATELTKGLSSPLIALFHAVFYGSIALLALAAAGLCVWLIYRRRRRKRYQHYNTPDVIGSPMSTRRPTKDLHKFRRRLLKMQQDSVTVMP